MKSSSTIGFILASMLLTLFFGAAFADQENATLSENLTNLTESKNTTYAVTNVNRNTNTITIQNNSLNIIFIGNMTEVINTITLQNATNATKNMARP